MYNFRIFTASELDQLTETILDILTKSKSEATLKLRESSICKKCGYGRVGKYGKTPNGKQRYRCLNCGAVLTETSFTEFSRSHCDLTVWKKYIECFLQGLSLEKCARICNISVRTAFLWRHKLLQLITMDAGRRLPHDEAVAFFANRVLNAESSSAEEPTKE
jgi:transposase-like protein